MTKDFEEFRRGMAALEPRGATERIPDHLRVLALRHVRRQRGAGVGWRQLSAELGVCTTTLHRWAAASSRRTESKAYRAVQRRSGAIAPVPVVVAPERTVTRSSSQRATPVLVSPSGFRLEGLTVDDAVALFERLR